MAFRHWGLRRRPRSVRRALAIGGLLAAALAAQAVALAARHGVGQQVVFGRSVDGRPLTAVELGEPHAEFTAVVVGCIDGDECAGIRIVQALERLTLPPFLDLWLIVDMNPDGRAADTLQNAHGVDLNRNFPWRWQVLGSRGYWQYSGPQPLSEPESRAVYRLLLHVHPRLVVWYHQPLTVVDESGGSVRLEAKYARLVGLPLRQLTRYPGSATSWADHTFRGSTSFVVELPPGPLTAAAAHRHAEAILSIARAAAAAARR